MNTGTRIREIRKSKNMTLRDLAEKLGVSFVYVGQIERGERTLSTDKLREWGEVLEVDLLEVEGKQNIKEKEIAQEQTEEEKILEAKRLYMKKWREKHKEEINSYARKWKKENKEKVKEYEERYWSKKAGLLK